MFGFSLEELCPSLEMPLNVINWRSISCFDGGEFPVVSGLDELEKLLAATRYSLCFQFVNVF